MNIILKNLRNKKKGNVSYHLNITDCSKKPYTISKGDEFDKIIIKRFSSLEKAHLSFDNVEGFEGYY